MLVPIATRIRSAARDPATAMKVASTNGTGRGCRCARGKSMRSAIRARRGGDRRSPGTGARDRECCPTPTQRTLRIGAGDSDRLRDDSPPHPSHPQVAEHAPCARLTRRFLGRVQTTNLDRGGTIDSGNHDAGTCRMSTAVEAGDSPLRLSTEVGLFGSVRRVVHAHPLQTDALMAAALLALSTLWLVTSVFSGPRTALVQATLIVPLVWRRSSPTVVFAVVSAVGLAQWLLDYRLIGDVALLVALYTVAVHESRVRTAI